jgi:hypothetical protein
MLPNITPSKTTVVTVLEQRVDVIEARSETRQQHAIPSPGVGGLLKGHFRCC